MEFTAYVPPLRRTIVLAFLVALVVAAGACRRGNSATTDKIDPSKIPTQELPGTLPDPIIVSGPGGRGTPTPSAATDSYTVGPGDTLAAIAVRFNTTVDEI